MINNIIAKKRRNRFIGSILLIQFVVSWIYAGYVPRFFHRRFYIFEIALFTIYLIYYYKSFFKLTIQNAASKKYVQVIVVFFAVAFMYLILSYFDLTRYWHLRTLSYEREYIYRHFMVVAEFLLPLGFGYAIHRSELLFKFKNYHILLASIAIYSLLFLTTSNYFNLHILYSSLAVALISLYAVRSKYFGFVIVAIYMVTSSHGAYNMAAILVIALYFGKKYVVSLLVKHTITTSVVLLCIALLLINIFWDSIWEKILNDSNALWRYQVWTNELETLADTMFTGVGFGSAYVTNDIYLIVNNSNMYVDSDGGGNIYDMLFKVANHNSFLNMFYRMGVLGGLIFIYMNLVLIAWAINCYQKSSAAMKKYIWWGFLNFMYNSVIILFNPGLEMVQFAINYVFSLSLLLGVLLTCSNPENNINGRIQIPNFERK